MSTTIPTAPVLVPTNVDVVLDELCRYLQITQSQYEQAESAYRGVGTWLSGDSALATYHPDLYPQGSMRLRTSVRPARYQEFDLDIVCQVQSWSGDPIALYNAVGRRLQENATYAPMLERMNRCWRLNYAGNFHLDVLPARPDDYRPGNAIEVPDRAMRDWSPSNPKDYAAWFDRVAKSFVVLEKRIDPLPDFDPAGARDPLRRAVQLMKRHRDLYFMGDEDCAPRSVVLTTLAAKYYNGQASIGEALLWILSGISAEIHATPGIMVVPNPTNPAENFADRWAAKPDEYRKFSTYIDEFASDLRNALAKPLGAGFEKEAELLFGAPAVNEAVVRYGKRAEEARKAQLRTIAVSSAPAARPWGYNR